MSATAVGRPPTGRVADSPVALRDPGAGPYPMGLMAVLATVTMLFAAFTAALLVRRTGSDWAPVALPPLLWVNTLALVISSVALEAARRAVRFGRQEAAVRRLAVTSLLGWLFLAGQIAAWRQLAIQGVFLPSGPYGAFFYMLSAVHAAHLIGGLGALGWTLRRLVAGAYTTGFAGLTHAAVYWHFLAGVWLYLFALLLLS